MSFSEASVYPVLPPGLPLALLWKHVSYARNGTSTRTPPYAQGITMPMASSPAQLSLSWLPSKHSFLPEYPSFPHLGETSRMMCSEERGP